MPTTLPGLHVSTYIFIVGDEISLQGVQTLGAADGITLGLNIKKGLGSMDISLKGIELGSSVVSSEGYNDGKLDSSFVGISLG